MILRSATALILLAFVSSAAHAQTDLSGPPPWDPAEVSLMSRELAPGVYAVLPDDVGTRDHVATTAGFVVGDRAVLVVESMVNGRLAAELLGLVRDVTDLPIRYVVNTSYHGDHSFGNYVFPAEAAVVQHAATKAYVDASFEEDRAFMIGLFGSGRGMESVRRRSADVVVADSLVRIDLGGTTVEVRHFGFGQTEGDLMVYVPSARVLWAGNAVEGAPPHLPWLLDGRHREMAATLRRVRAFLPDDATVVLGHDAPAGPEALDFAVGYLEALDAEVAAAVADGLSLEETVAQVRLPEYAGYSMFGLAHDQINVPAVYGALTRGE